MMNERAQIIMRVHPLSGEADRLGESSLKTLCKVSTLSTLRASLWHAYDEAGGKGGIPYRASLSRGRIWEVEREWRK